MQHENLNMEEITGMRRKAIAETIRVADADELKSLGEDMFPYFDHPWRETYYAFLQENAGATFYHAHTPDGVHFLYCRDREKGIWFIPGSGRGPLQAKGLQALKEIVDEMGKV